MSKRRGKDRNQTSIAGWLLLPLFIGGLVAPLPTAAAPPMANLTAADDSHSAQVNSDQNQLPESTLNPLEQPVPLEGTELPTAPGTSEAADVEVLVERFDISGNTVFSDRELQRELQIFTGRPLDFQDLQRAADAITQKYLNQGYITSRATLPQDQTISDGVVEILVTEGELEIIEVEGSEQLEDYIRSRVALGGTRPFNQTQMEEQLRLLRADPLFSNVEARLRSGSEVGQSILVVRVTEANPFSSNLSLDTLSPPSVGKFRLGANFELRNLTGLGDTLQTAAYRSTTSGSQIYELSYRLPVSPMDGAVLLRMNPNNFRITDPDSPSFDLDLSGSTDIYELIYRQPLVRSPQEEFALSLGFRYRRGNTLIGNLITPATTTSVFSFGQDYLKRDMSGVWNVRSQFRLGTDLFNASTGGGIDGQFLSWNGQLQRVQVLGPDHLLILRADLQLTGESLVGSEQFYVGGQQSVRGYDQNARFGDNGLRLSIEDQIVLNRDESGTPFVQISPFLDMGYVWSAGEISITQQNFLIGTGMGFLASPTPNLDLRVDLGVPLVKLREFPDDNSAGLQVYFTVNYRL